MMLIIEGTILNYILLQIIYAGIYRSEYRMLVVLYGAQTWTLEKYLEKFGIWIWQRMEMVLWTDSISKKSERRKSILEMNNRKENKLLWVYIKKHECADNYN